MELKKSSYTFIEGYVTAVISVAFATGGLWLLRHILEKAHVGLVYLLVVASVASIAGIRPALLAAVLSFLLWNFFFLLPVYTFTIHDPRDWILLCVFLIIGIMVGQITGQIRVREEDAIAREQDTSALYRAIMSINSQTDFEQILRELVDQVIFNAKAMGCAILKINEETQTFEILAKSGIVNLLDEEQTLNIAQEAIRQSVAVGLCKPPENASYDTPWPIIKSHSDILQGTGSRLDAFLPMYAGLKPVGFMYAISNERMFNISNSRLLIAFANNAATLIERQNLLNEAAQAAALRETERLKAVLFSSISHNLKTPLASLNATISSLRQEDIQWDRINIQEQFSFMAEDISRLTENIEKLLDLAQLESGSWQPQKELFELREIISTAVGKLPEHQYKRLVIEIPDELPLVLADAVQMAQVVRHLVENALDYSPSDSKVKIVSSYSDNMVKFSVKDRGSGIDVSEQEEIFRKFYRGKAAKDRSIRGTGLGLSICKEIIQAHGGTISLKSSHKKGSAFTVSLPIDKK